MSIEKLNFSEVTKEGTPYTVILNNIILNIKDSESFHIWAYLYSHSGNWSVIKEHIKSKFNIGEAKLKRIFSYLNRSKLIQYTQNRNDDGKMGAHSIHVLNGSCFDQSIEFHTGGSEPIPAAKTGGSITVRAENRSNGSGGLLNKRNYEIKEKAQKEREGTLLYDDFLPDEKTYQKINSLNSLTAQEKNIQHIKFFEYHQRHKTLSTDWNYELRKWMLDAVTYKLRNEAV